MDGQLERTGDLADTWPETKGETSCHDVGEANVKQNILKLQQVARTGHVAGVLTKQCAESNLGHDELVHHMDVGTQMSAGLWAAA